MNTTLIAGSTTLPSIDEMYAALCRRDSHYEGVFIAAVKSTGIFCRPTCPARKPKRENVVYFHNVGEALAAGFRACKRCKPLDGLEETPDWISELLADVEGAPAFRWTDQRLQQRGIQPATLRRWFNRHYGMTFQAYQRKRRLALAAAQIQNGDHVTQAAFDHGYESLSGFRDAFQKWYGEVPCSAKADTPPLTLSRINTPLGPMIAGVLDDALCLLEFADRIDLESQFKKLVSLTRRAFVFGSHPLFGRLQKQLAEYFDGQRQSFDLPLVTPGSKFQQKVWDALRTIPCGQTHSYGQIARLLDNSGGSRAVGRANGSNRIAIVIPCHRVVRSDGTPGGYAGEVWRKKRLLDLERSSRSRSRSCS